MMSGETMEDMRDGDKLRKLIQEVTNFSKVGRSCDPPVTPTTIGRWLDGLNDNTITDDQWRQFARGLAHQGVDGTRVRPLPVPSSGTLRADLIPLLDRFTTRKQLEGLRDILHEPGGHATLLVIINERLRTIP